MKKVLLITMFSFIVMLGFSNSIKAEGEIDLYPYDNIACLQALSTCPNTKVGDSNWSFTYYGHTYYVINGLVRYGHEMVDISSDGFIDDSELAGIPYNAFASVFMNDTASEIIVKTANARTDITDVVHRKYAYFNETGALAMVEDHISTYYIFNDGDATTPDWRMASQAEIDAYLAEVAAETIVAGAPSADGLTRKTHIRIALDAVDTDGYVVEPLSYLKWSNADVDTTTELDKTKWSTILAEDPNNVYIPAGWTVVSFGTNDRGTVNTKTRDFIEMLPAALAALTTAPATFDYVDQPAWFNGLTALDDDAGTPGINVVVDYNGTFVLPTTIEAEWRNMFDDTTQEVINSVEKLDYTVVISQDGVDLETITYTWNETTMMYDASAEQTVVDSSVFGSGYVATYSTTSTEGDITTQEVDIVIGVMPPKFAGVADRYVDENVFVDLLLGITADDGYANDVTDTIMVTTPNNFNMYNPLPGAYLIELEFSHHVHFDGVAAVLEVNGVPQTWDGVLNPTVGINANGGRFMVYTDSAVFQVAASGWGSVLTVVGADGLVKEIYDRYDWSYTTSEGTVTGDAVAFAAWQAAVVIEEGGYAVAAHGTPNGQTLRDTVLPIGSPINIVIPVPDFDYDIITNESYMLTVDDKTAPQALVLNDEYMIVAGQYTSIDDAILANVVAFDLFDNPEDLAIFVSNNGGLLLTTVGSYNVEVTVEDEAGNTDIVTFTVKVVAAGLTVAEVQAMLDAQTITLAEVQALLDAQTITLAEVQALLDAQTLTAAEIQALIDTATEVPEDTGCGSSIAIGSSVILLVTALGGAGLFISRKKTK